MLEHVRPADRVKILGARTRLCLVLNPPETEAESLELNWCDMGCKSLCYPYNKTNFI